MIDVKKIASMTKDQQLGLLRSKVVIAKEALDQAKEDSEQVQQILSEYVKECEKMLEKAMWSL
jgi:hypothetical protein